MVQYRDELDRVIEKLHGVEVWNKDWRRRKNKAQTGGWLPVRNTPKYWTDNKKINAQSSRKKLAKSLANRAKNFWFLLRQFKESVSELQPPMMNFSPMKSFMRTLLKRDRNNMPLLQRKQQSSEKDSGKYWDGQFKESVSGITATNDELVKMEYYSSIQSEASKAAQAQEKDIKRTIVGTIQGIQVKRYYCAK